MQDAKQNSGCCSSATKRTKTRLVMVLGMLTLLLSQMRAADRQPHYLAKGYIPPARPSLFTIKRAIIRWESPFLGMNHEPTKANVSADTALVQMEIGMTGGGGGEMMHCEQLLEHSAR